MREASIMPITPNAAWYAEGMEWLGSLFSSEAAEQLPEGHRKPYLDPEEFLFDVRHRMQNRF
jgi:hypothetical protein